MRPLFASSDVAKTTAGQSPRQSKYPWREMTVGQSFGVNHGETKYNTLKSHAWKMGRKLGKQFRVVDHGEGGFEVACVGIVQESGE